jgi:hypothetical protein
MAKQPQVRITWNGMGGELDSVTVTNDSEHALTDALVKLVQGNIVSPGDSITVEEIEGSK